MVDEEELAADDAVTVDVVGNGLSLPREDSFLLSLSLSFSLSDFGLCDDFPSTSLCKIS